MAGHVHYLTARSFLTVSPRGVCCMVRPAGTLQNTRSPTSDTTGLVRWEPTTWAFWLVELGPFRGVFDWIHPALSLYDPPRTPLPFFYMRELFPCGKVFPQ